MTTSVSIRTQAKLNLWLRVIAREESGYHSIETLFHRIELHDDVVVALAPEAERTVACSEDVGPDRENLAFRAAELYCSEANWPTGFHIEITKRIPASGGLGGGSADAAATIRALNAMAPRPLSNAELSQLGGKLGADIPFLLTDAAAALAWGRGDRMLTIPALPQRHVALVIPPFGISTAEAYRTLGAPAGSRGKQLAMSDLLDWQCIAALAGNDLAESLTALSHAQLAAGVAALRTAGATMAGMTGSGSVLFGVFDFMPDAQSLKRSTGMDVITTRTALNVEPPIRLD